MLDLSIEFIKPGQFRLQDLLGLAGLSLALITLAVGWITYRGNARDVARSQMHSIFREFLALSVHSPNASPEDLIAFKFYALEEVFFWAKRERCGRLIPLPEKEFVAWLRTIDFHILDDQQASAAYLADKRAMFGEAFYAYAVRLLTGMEHPHWRRWVEIFGNKQAYRDKQTEEAAALTLPSLAIEGVDPAPAATPPIAGEPKAQPSPDQVRGDNE